MRERTTHPMAGAVARIAARTPPERDRAVDGLRALAVLGVVLGHWLVTALVADSGIVRVASPLRAVPELAPLSWPLQTLAVFFLVGGWSNQVSRAGRGEAIGDHRRWLVGRLGRLFRPVAPVLAVWAVAAGGMLAAGAELETVRTLARLVLSPLWFLLVFALLTAATPVVARLHPAWPLAVVGGADLVRFTGGPDWVGSVNVVAGWLVPYCLGMRWARGPLPRRAARWLLAGGGFATAVLVVAAGYPAAMVGVPGAPVSNLDPPTLAAVTFGIAQCGAAVLLVRPLRRALRRPVAWAAVVAVNLTTMTIFLWHQTALIAVTAAVLPLTGPLPGLHTAPADPGWALARLAWLPVFAVALLACCAVFHSYERGASPRGRGRRVGA